MRLVIVQHNRFEHAGRFLPMLAHDGVDIQVVHAPETAPGDWPEASAFDALWVLGGVMQVWETEEYPWLVDEIGFIRRTVAEWRKPYLGICFGHQLLATALGGTVGLAPAVEYGVHRVHRSDGANPLLDGLDASFAAFQWHAAQVVSPPETLDIVAANPACGNQVMSGQHPAGSVQFHPEVDVATMRNWLATPGCTEDLIRMRGEGADAALLDMLATAEPDLDRLARALYANWMRIARGAIPAPTPAAARHGA